MHTGFTVGVVSDILVWVEGTYQRCRRYCKSGATEATAPNCRSLSGLLYPLLKFPAIDIMRTRYNLREDSFRRPCDGITCLYLS